MKLKELKTGNVLYGFTEASYHYGQDEYIKSSYTGSNNIKLRSIGIVLNNKIISTKTGEPILSINYKNKDNDVGKYGIMRILDSSSSKNIIYLNCLDDEKLFLSYLPKNWKYILVRSWSKPILYEDKDRKISKVLELPEKMFQTLTETDDIIIPIQLILKESEVL